MYAQNGLFLAVVSLLNAQIALTAIWTSSWKLYFSQQWRPGLEVDVSCMAPSPGAGLQVPASAPSLAGGVGGSSAGRVPFSPAAGAGDAGASAAGAAC